MLKPKVLLINPSAEESLGVLEGPLAAAGAQVVEYASKEVVQLMVSGEPSATAKVVLSSELPRTARGYDALVLLGSPLGVLTGEGEKEPDQTPKETIVACEELIRDFTKASKPVLGLCLGAQLVARAFGGEVKTLPKDPEHTALPVPLQTGGPGTAPSRELGLEFGWQAQTFTPAAKEDAVIGAALTAWKGVDSGDGSALRSEPKFKQWHSDCFELPPGAVALSTRTTCPSQAFRMGECTYAFQYHIEVGKTLAEEWYHDYAEGNDSFVEGESRSPLTDAEQEAFRASLAADVSSGAIARAEAFAEAVMAGLLARAKARARATALRTAAGISALVFVLAGVALARRR